MEAALAILARRFAEGSGGTAAPTDQQLPSPPVFDLTGFQQDAVRRARQILAERRGALIADSVGLGKTYIALALIEDALRAGERVGVVTPAALRRNWLLPLGKLARSLGIRAPSGVGGNERQDHPDPLLTWTSHARLGRGTAPAELQAGLDLVVVDEAHAFRNPRTRRYRALAEISRSARVLLITATPVNNSLADLYHLIRLFAGDGAFRDVGIPDLAEAIRAASAAPRTGQTAPSLEPLLRAIMIRRTREIVREQMHNETQNHAPPADHVLPSFPRRAAPTAIHYDLDRVYAGFLPELTEALAALTLAPFRLGAYGTTYPGAAKAAPSELIRLGLLKRLESSLAAFRNSISRQLRFVTAFIESLDRGLLRLPADHHTLYGQGDVEGAQLALEELALRPLPPDLDLVRLRHDAELDRTRLRSVKVRLDLLGDKSDPKLERLRALLEDELDGEKIVVFTEFRETARYLWRQLRARGSTALIDGGGAFLGAGPAGRQEVITRFAPRANHATPPPPHESVNLLLATDVLAEGLNLQDANYLISYDLPWNPVRLIQRIGRVDRIASPHAVVYPYHFLPDRGLDEILRIVTRLQVKLAEIRQAVDENFEIVGNREESLGMHTGDTKMEGEDGSGREGVLAAGTEEKLRAAYYRARREWDMASQTDTRAAGDQPAESATGSSLPVAAVIPAPPGASHLLLIACRIARQVVFLIQRATPSASAYQDDIAATEILLSVLMQPDAAPSPPDQARSILAPDSTLVRRAWYAARLAARHHLAATDAADTLPANTPGARAARRLLAILTTTPGNPDPALCRRADELLSLLARRQDAGTEARILAILSRDPGTPPERALNLIRALEGALTPKIASIPPPIPTPPAASERPTDRLSSRASSNFELIGIIERRPGID
jgi:superfamily II DNA or RNA helicase